MGKVIRFEELRPDQARAEALSVAKAFAEFPAYLFPPQLRAKVLRELGQKAAPEEDHWPGGYVMLSRVQAAAVWHAIWNDPSIQRRNQVHRAFDLIMVYVEEGTGEVLLTRADLAERIGASPENVTSVMKTLKRLGVIHKTERRRIPGKQGAGEIVYFVNPHVAWNGFLRVRTEKAANVQPPKVKQPRELRLVKGGKGNGSGGDSGIASELPLCSPLRNGEQGDGRTPLPRGGADPVQDGKTGRRPRT